MSVNRFLEETATLVETALGEALPPEEAPPATLHRAMRYAVFAGGKRIRPAFTLAAARLGEPTNSLLRASMAAIELIHTYSLIHDDLPSMDDDDMRRGKPSCHIVFGEATATLAGDALQTLAFEVLADGSEPARLRSIHLLADAAGHAGMVAGQTRDLAAETVRPADPESELRLIHEQKTGALIGAALGLGGIAGGLSRENVSRLVEIGRNIGVAFQIRDDLLDLEATAREVGKRTGKDAARGKLTYPALFGIDGSRSEAERLGSASAELLAILPGDKTDLTALARLVIERRN